MLPTQRFPTLLDALDRQLDNGPPDLDLLEKTLPTLQTQLPPNLKPLLTLTTHRALARLQAVAHDYPEATPYTTQLQRLQPLLGL